ncbi:MAG: hypothetical protein U0610_17615 [bacterium]
MSLAPVSAIRTPPSPRAVEPRARQLPADVERMLTWLLAGPVRDADGCLKSWCDDARPGFRYAEATGFLVRVLLDLHQRAGSDELCREARRSARALVSEQHPSGGFGRDDALYSFDSGVCLSAWLRLLEIEGGAADAEIPAAAAAAARFLDAAVRARHAALRVADGTPIAPARWSLAFGPHQLKAVHALTRAERLGLARRASATALAPTQRIAAAHWHDDHFHWSPSHCASYAHAHCYALEGLLAHQRDGLAPPRARAMLAAGADWLARVQSASGAIPSWHGDAAEPPLHPADATAQAVRIWVVVDRARHAAAIERALAFLDSLTEPDGGVRYAASRPERSSWATLFAIQAKLLARLGPSEDPIA